MEGEALHPPDIWRGSMVTRDERLLLHQKCYRKSGDEKASLSMRAAMASEKRVRLSLIVWEGLVWGKKCVENQLKAEGCVNEWRERAWLWLDESLENYVRGWYRLYISVFTDIQGMNTLRRMPKFLKYPDFTITIDILHSNIKHSIAVFIFCVLGCAVSSEYESHSVSPVLVQSQFSYVFSLLQ